MRALIVASMAASLLFSSGTPSSAEGARKMKAFLEALIDLNKTPEEGVDMPTTSTQPQPQPEPHPPKGK